MRRLPVLFVTGILCLGLTACGGDDSGGDDSGGDASNPTTGTSAPTAGGDPTEDATDDGAGDGADDATYAAEDYCGGIDADAVTRLLGKGTTLAHHAPGETYEQIEGIPQESLGHECTGLGKGAAAYLVVQTDGEGTEEYETLLAGGYGPPSVACEPEQVPDGLPEDSAAGFCADDGTGSFPIPEAVVVIGKLGETTFTCSISVPPNSDFPPALRDQALDFCGTAAEAATA